VKREIAFFDFDGTITTKDTLLEFIKFSKGSFRFYLGFIINAPYLLAFKLGIITNQSAKEKILRFFFHDTPAGAFKKHCEDFSRSVLPKLIRPKAVDEIYKLKQNNIIIAVVSASPENWIEAWAKSLGLELIASRLEVSAGKLTGKILGKNCHGNEKVSRIREAYDLTDYFIVAAYGDTSGDKPMLELAKEAHYKPFN